MFKKLWLAMASLLVLMLAGSPRSALAACLMDGSICVSPSECCSHRCLVSDGGEEYGVCDPLPDPQ